MMDNAMLVSRELNPVIYFNSLCRNSSFIKKREVTGSLSKGRSKRPIRLDSDWEVAGIVKATYCVSAIYYDSSK